MGDPTIVFSAVGTVQDMRELVDLAARGRGAHPREPHRLAVGARHDLRRARAGAQYLGRAVITDLTR